MRDESWATMGSLAGALAVILFVAGAVVTGERPAFDAPAGELVAYLAEERTRVQVSGVLFAAMAPFFVWWLVTVGSLARGERRPAAGRAAAVAQGCGLIFLTMFLVDVTALEVAALRPENMAANPELAVALTDFELLLMGMASLAVVGMLVAFAILTLRDRAVWPRWLGWLAVVAAPAYGLRVGTLFTTDGPFAADGVLGLWVPVATLASWILLASFALVIKVRKI
jgi:hypothetical protein